MTDQQEEKYGMYLSVAKFFETNWSLFGALPQFPPQTLKLKNLIVKISKEDGIATANMKGDTVVKQTTRDTLVEISKTVSKALLSYGRNNGSPYIIEEDDYLPSALSKATDSELYVLAVLLWRKADPVKASLAIFGSSPADVALLSTTADSFVEQIRVPATNAKARSRAIGNRKQYFADTEVVMQTLDDLMAVYAYTDANLFGRYRSARKPQHLAGGKRVHKKKGRVLPGSVANAPFKEKALKGVKHFIFYNEGKQKDAKLAFYFAAEANQPPQQDSKLIAVKSGEKTTMAVADTGYSAATPHLNIYNPNAQMGQWKAEVKKE
jgi:hypothetical protein